MTHSGPAYDKKYKEEQRFGEDLHRNYTADSVCLADKHWAALQREAFTIYSSKAECIYTHGVWALPAYNCGPAQFLLASSVLSERARAAEWRLQD